jgi:L-alanine-DL-glutamate epimerase-like enolase superfamily enzyme
MPRRHPHPFFASETLTSIFRLIDLLQTESAGAIMIDLSWYAEIMEAKRIVEIVEARKLPIALHDCTIPIAPVAPAPWCGKYIRAGIVALSLTLGHSGRLLNDAKTEAQPASRKAADFYFCKPI